MTLFKAGMRGAIASGVAEWSALYTESLQDICVPFTGSAKTVAAMADARKCIESWDTQVASRGIVEGVFAAERLQSSVRVPKFRKGYMYETRAIAGIDAASAGLVDYIGKYGTIADKAAISSAVTRCTQMGRMGTWTGNVEQLWAKFQKSRSYLAGYVNLPGQFTHHEANVYQVPPQGKYDAVLIDPPKVVSTTDIYSAHYQDLNTALGGAVPIPEWRREHVLVRLEELIALPARWVLLLYTSEVHPTMDEIRWLLSRYGQIVVEDRYRHRSRYDYCILLDKEA